MLGRLNYDALPFYSPIAFTGAFSEVAAGVIIVGLLTYYKLWGPFWRDWLTTLDHKRLGVMYIVIALVMLLRGFSDALMMRAQQAMAYNSQGYLVPDHFNQVFSVHGTIMVFFVAMPFVTGLMNLLIPLQIGARDVAFPFLNAVGLYLTGSSAALVLLSLVIGKFSTSGWTGYASYSEAMFDPGTGMEYWLWALIISGFGTTISSINFMVTIIRKRAPGMRFMMMPLFTWTSFISSIMMLFAFPALTVVTILLTLDRLAGFHFFTNEQGGNLMMYANLFWIWGHPEVYILVLPAFGVYSEVAATFSGKKIFGYESLVYATAAIAVLSFTVWLHHFFTMGASARVNAVFGISTMVIAVPTGVKVFNWIFTMYRGRIRFTNPMRWLIAFILTFVIGGMTGVIHAMPPADYSLQNTTFLIAHFHNMLIPGVLFGMFAGYNYWFPKAFGFKLDELWGRRSFYLWVFGFLFAFMPLYATGLMGMPRRMQTYTNPEFQMPLIIALFGTLMIAAGVACMVVQLVVSIKNRHALADLTGDPWDARTLEWATSSPPKPYNFAVVPVVTARDDFWEMKKRRVAYVLPDKFVDILLPKNSMLPLMLGAGAFILGFGMIWFMWWLAIIGLLTIFAAVVLRSFDDHTEYVLPAAEVEAIEKKRIEIALNAPPVEKADALAEISTSGQGQPA